MLKFRIYERYVYKFIRTQFIDCVFKIRTMIIRNAIK